jgi:hypothetical protein
VKRAVKKSRFVSLVAAFAAINFICDVIVFPQLSEGVWYGLVFISEPITGIVLGPYAGFLSTFIGVMVSHVISPRGVEEFLFTIGAPIGAMVSGLMLTGGLKKVLAYYSILLASYFITPVAWQLPTLGMWDVYFAYIALLAIILLVAAKGGSIKGLNRTPVFLAVYAFVGLEADVLFRIFLFVPCQTYRFLYGLPVEALQAIWVAGAVVTPIKVAISALVTASLGVRLLKITDVWPTKE